MQVQVVAGGLHLVNLLSKQYSLSTTQRVDSVRQVADRLHVARLDLFRFLLLSNQLLLQLSYLQVFVLQSPVGEDQLEVRLVLVDLELHIVPILLQLAQQQ